MKVLVTGASGFIGRNVVEQLVARGYRVIAVSRDETRARALPWFGTVKFLARDIHRLDGDPFTALGEPDIVMHFAWPGLPDYKKLDHFERTLPEDYRFLKGLIDGGAKHLLVTGTCFEYGLLNGYLDESMPCVPSTPYGLAKDCLRRMLEFATRATPVTFQWARLFYMYGPGQHPSSLLSQLERAIASSDAAFNMSGGEQLRDYLPVAQVAAHLVSLIEHPECTGIVNVCRGEPISVRRLVEQQVAERGAAIRLNLGHYPYAAHEPMAFWGNPSKLRAALGEHKS